MWLLHVMYTVTKASGGVLKGKHLKKNPNKTHYSLFGVFLTLSSLNSTGSCEEEVYIPIIFNSIQFFLDTYLICHFHKQPSDNLTITRESTVLYIIASRAHWSRQNPKYLCKMSIKCLKSVSRLQMIVFNLLNFVMLESKLGIHWAPPATTSWKANSSYLFQTSF